MVFKTDNPADPFKKALGEATRALAREAELDVTYAAAPHGLTNTGPRPPPVGGGGSGELTGMQAWETGLSSGF